MEIHQVNTDHARNYVLWPKMDLEIEELFTSCQKLKVLNT